MRKFFAALAVLCLPTLAAAQNPGCGNGATIVVNPTKFCFESPNWDDTSFGQPLVGNARIYVFTQGSDVNGTPIVTVDVGHPNPDPTKTSANYYVVKGNFPKPALLAADGQTVYIAVAEQSLNGGGVQRSAAGNPFGYSKPQILPVKPPMLSQALPLKSLGPASCALANACEYSSESIALSMEPVSTSFKWTPLGMAKPVGRLAARMTQHWT